MGIGEREMIRTQIEKQLWKIGAKQDGKEFRLDKCSVVGFTRLCRFGDAFIVKMFLHTDSTMGITLIANKWADQIITYENFVDLVITVKDNTMTIKGRNCKLIIEKEEE